MINNIVKMGKIYNIYIYNKLTYRVANKDQGLKNLETCMYQPHIFLVYLSSKHT